MVEHQNGLCKKKKCARPLRKCKQNCSKTCKKKRYEKICGGCAQCAPKTVDPLPGPYCRQETCAAAAAGTHPMCREKEC